jgi:hypothetical protein
MVLRDTGKCVELYNKIFDLNIGEGCFTIDYTATQIDRTPNRKICEQTTFYPTDLVSYTVVGGAGVALDQVHYATW